MRFVFLVITVLCAAAAMLPVRAHHSQGMYDISAWTTLHGTIRQVRWTNPHAWVFIDVDDGQGHVQTWALEGGSPGALEGDGIRREDLQPGDRASARCHRLRDGSAGCVLGFVTPLHGDPARGHGVEKPWN